jgi:hypothetical protein
VGDMVGEGFGKIKIENIEKVKYIAINKLFC